MLSKNTRKKLLEQIHIETKQLLNATVLCRDVNTPSEIFDAMQKCPATKQGLINYVKYAHMLIVVLAYSYSKAKGNKNAGKIFIKYNTSFINEAVLTSLSIRELLINISYILNVAIDEVTRMIKEDVNNE